MNARNYDEEMREELLRGAGKSLLLHGCCAPCSSYCLTQVAPVLRTTVFFYNPNLDSEEEFVRREGEVERLLKETGLAALLRCGYRHEEFEKAAAGLEECPEGGARCARCFALRLGRTAEEAKARGFDYFGTTLTVSPHKNAALINEIGLRMQERYGVKYLPSDFKKRGGYLRSVELSKEHGLYRQNYCGCRFSKRDGS